MYNYLLLFSTNLLVILTYTILSIIKKKKYIKKKKIYKYSGSIYYTIRKQYEYTNLNVNLRSIPYINTYEQ